MSKSEQDRYERLREAQIRARDPGPSKIRHYDWDKHAKRQKTIKKSHQKPLIVDLFDVLPSRWKGALIGLVLGIIPLIAAQLLLTGEWVVLGALGMLMLGVIGFVIGAVLNKREEVHR